MKRRPGDDINSTLITADGREIPLGTVADMNAAADAIRAHRKGESMRTERLPVTLTDDEVRVRGEELAVLVRDINDAEEAKKSAAAKAKAEIDELGEKAAGIAEEIRPKRVYREVEVREDLDTVRRIVTVLRLDTGEVVRERTATASDLQGIFPALAPVLDGPGRKSS